MRPPLRQTHTFVELELSQAAFDEIRKKLDDAGYQHTFHDDGQLIDMHGIAVKAESWVCQHCNQTNCSWSKECGRCEKPRITPPWEYKYAGRAMLLLIWIIITAFSAALVMSFADSIQWRYAGGAYLLGTVTYAFYVNICRKRKP